MAGNASITGETCTYHAITINPSGKSGAKWLLHSYEVCDAVERTTYTIDGIPVSNFVTSSYFREGDAPGRRNDFLGVGVPSFGVTEGSHLGVINPATGDFETIFGRQAPSARAFARRLEAFDREKPKRPADETLDKILCCHNEKPPEGCQGLHALPGITRTSRYNAAALRRRQERNK